LFSSIAQSVFVDCEAPTHTRVMAQQLLRHLETSKQNTA